MLLQKKHKINYLGPSIFIVLFFLCAFAFYEILIKPPGRVFYYELSSVSSNAIVLNKIQQSSLNKNWLPQLDNSNIKLLSERIKLLTSNRLITQRIIDLQKAELSIILIKPPGFYYHYRYRDTEDLPVLS
jgi:hypothetical protein